MRRGLWLGLVGVLTLGAASPALADDPPKPAGGKPPAGAPAAPKAPPSGEPKPAAPPPKVPGKPPAPKPSGGKPTAPKSAPKPAAPAKPDKKPGKPRADRPLPRLPGSKPGEPDESVRQILTADYSTVPRAASVAPEVERMREVDRLLFPPGELRSAGRTDGAGPSLSVTGLPTASPAAAPTPAAPAPLASDLAWLSQLDLPDVPVRFTPALLRYLEYYKEDPKGRALIASFVRKSGRYRDGILKVLRQEHLPEALLWLALVESGFDPSAYSHAGAAGLWQFVPETARIYGLTVNRRVDERLDPERATVAAARHLGDLHKRFGSWELAFAAYNMGFGGLLTSIRKYNTNDFWELERLEAALPYETALYVPKILAVAVAAKNCALFGCDGVTLDKPEPFDAVAVGPGVSFESIADASGASLAELAQLNPAFAGTRTPALEASETPRASWTVRVPAGSGARTQQRLEAGELPGAALAGETVRWGETLERIAERHGTSRAALEKLNDLASGEPARPGTALLVPKNTVAAKTAPGPKPVVVVPDEDFGPADARRMLYQVVHGDTVGDVARVCGVSAEEVRRWNHLDVHAALQEGMRLQLFLPRDHVPANAVLADPADFEIVKVGSDPFFAHFEGKKGRRRLEVTVGAGDTWRSIAARYGLTLGQLERINHRSRGSRLLAGESVVVYAPSGAAPLGPVAAATPAAAAPPATENDLALALDEPATAEATEPALTAPGTSDDPPAGPVPPLDPAPPRPTTGG
ncbi:MAG: transglycosylase SLT domain-containing protein [Polyangiaceae bacterium]|nr:transglycosylase SLT domain-containing protein [Polyangiaceae bacterium]